MVVKVADFGVARVQDQSGVMTAETGTYRWMALEMASAAISFDSKSLDGTLTMTIDFSLWSIPLYLVTLISCLAYCKSVDTSAAADISAVRSIAFLLLANVANFILHWRWRSELAKSSWRLCEKASVAVSFDSVSQHRKIVISDPSAFRIVALYFFIGTMFNCYLILCVKERALGALGLLPVVVVAMITMYPLSRLYVEQHLYLRKLAATNRKTMVV